jgi:hypothetical protein
MSQSVPGKHIAVLFLISTLCACSEGKSNSPRLVQSASAAVAPSTAADCDASLWNHVYKPSRLRQLASCLSVTGVIEESSANSDGDQHFLLRLDRGQDTLVNKRNLKKKHGDLVLEIVCANPTSMKKVKSACAGYTNRVPLAAVGEHVRATGTYVIDSDNGWAEIHPVSKLANVR